MPQQPTHPDSSSLLVSVNNGPLERVPTLDVLVERSGLSQLSLSGNPPLADLSPLARLPSLRWLSVGGCPLIEDLAPLAGLTDLAYLDLAFCPRVRDLAPLAGLRRLDHLILRGCTVADLRPLAGLAALAYLDLNHTPQVTDLAPLAGLGSLRQLLLWGCPALHDLRPVLGLDLLRLQVEPDKVPDPTAPADPSPAGPRPEARAALERLDQAFNARRAVEFEAGPLGDMRDHGYGGPDVQARLDELERERRRLRDEVERSAREAWAADPGALAAWARGRFAAAVADCARELAEHGVAEPRAKRIVAELGKGAFSALQDLDLDQTQRELERWWALARCRSVDEARGYL